MVWLKLFGILTFHLLLLKVYGKILPAVVYTPDGPLHGRLEQSRSSREYAAFRGIRYATVPGRFELSVPVKPWKELKSAEESGPRCPGTNIMDASISAETEDCLYLDVNAPMGKENLPVYVFIHGGGYVGGTGSNYGPNLLLDEDVILVTPNYRLGILGFLNSEDGYVPANVGLKDLILALKWIQRNIAAFGGDPGKVTLSGESAGAAAAWLLAISPASKGLLHRLIVQSGSGMGQWAVTPNPLEKELDFATKVGCPTLKKTAAVIECLRKAPLEDLMAQEALPNNVMIEGWAMINFGPSVELVKSSSPDDYMILTASPYQMAQEAAHLQNVPVLIGSNAYDGYIISAAAHITNDTMMEHLYENWENVTATMFHYERFVPPAQLQAFADKLRSIYYKDYPSASNAESYIKLHEDLNFDRAIHLTALTLTKNKAPVYVYKFMFKGSFSISTLRGNPEFNPTHADELQYLFAPLAELDVPWPPLAPQSTYDSFSKKFVKLWTSFARDGAPTATWGNVRWEPVTLEQAEKADYPWMYIDEKLEMKTDPKLLKRVILLHKLFSAYKDPVIYTTLE